MRPRSALALAALAAALAYPTARALSDDEKPLRRPDEGKRAPRRGEDEDAPTRPGPAGPAPRAPSQKVGSAGIRLRGHVGTLAFTPDGKRVLVGGHSASELPFFEVATGSLASKLQGEPSWANACLSPDGKLAAAAGRSLQIWDVSTGKIVLEVPGNSLGHLPIAFSPDGKELFAANASPFLDRVPPGPRDDAADVRGRIVAYDVASKKPRLTIAGDKTLDWKSLAVSPDGKVLAVGADSYTEGAIVLHDATSGAVLRKLVAGKLSIGALAFSGDGAALAAVTEEGRIHVFEVATGALRFALKAGENNFLRAVAFSPDGKHVAAGGNMRSVQLWDARTGGPGPSLDTAWSFVGGLAFSPDGKRLAAASDDTQQGTVELWEVEGWKPVVTGVAHAGPVDEIAFTHGGQALVTTCHGENGLRTWTLASGAPGLAIRAQSSLLSASAGAILAVADGGVVSLHDLAKGAALARVEIDRILVSALAVSPDGSVCVAAGSDECVRAFATADGKLLWKSELHATLGGGFVTSLSFDSEGKRIACSAAHASPSWDQSGTGSLGSLDAKTGKSLTLKKGLPVRLTQAAFAADGTLVGLGRWLNAFHLFDGETGEARSQAPGDRYLFTSAALSPDGRTLLFGSEHGVVLRHRPDPADKAGAFVALCGKATPGRSRLLPVRPANPAEDRISPAPEAPVTGLTVSPDGKRLAACFADGLVRVLDVEKPGGETPGRELVLGDAPARLTAVAFSPDGKRLAAGCSDGTARVFDLAD